MKALNRITLTLSALLIVAAAQAEDAQTPVTEVPRQVILIIGDGMDEQQVTIARNYWPKIL